MRIYNLKSISVRKGFTLIELITAMAITSVLLIVFLTILSVGIKATKTVSDDHLISRQYALSLMEKEMERADRIYDIRRWRNVHPKNLGFLIKGPSYQKDGYVYIYYYHTRNNLYRTAVNVTNEIKRPQSYPFLKGSSKLCEDVDIQINFSWEDKYLNIELLGTPPVAGFIYLDHLEQGEIQ